MQNVEQNPRLQDVNIFLSVTSQCKYNTPTHVCTNNCINTCLKQYSPALLGSMVMVNIFVAIMQGPRYVTLA